MSDEPIRVDSRAWTGDVAISPQDAKDLRAAFSKGEVFERIIALTLVSAVTDAPFVRVDISPREPEEVRAAFKKRFPRVVIAVVAALLGVLICFATM